MNNLNKVLVITTRVNVPLSLKERFIDWQSKLNSTISSFPGFLSLEILSPKQHEEAWIIVQRFAGSDWLNHWVQSEERQTLITTLKEMLPDKSVDIHEEESHSPHIQGGVTEIFVTQVASGMESAYRDWGAKINRIEARYPGFRGVYLQAPAEGHGNRWITLLQFDSQSNLDHWLSSAERKKVLEEAAQFVSSCESHRVISPYAGWFSSLPHDSQTTPPVWQQTMIILLVLFPVVMIEFKYLRQVTEAMNPSLATFIGNAISVILLAWPLVPLAIRCLNWWLSPQENHKAKTLFLGTALVCLLYLFEVYIFWQ